MNKFIINLKDRFDRYRLMWRRTTGLEKFIGLYVVLWLSVVGTMVFVIFKLLFALIGFLEANT